MNRRIGNKKKICICFIVLAAGMMFLFFRVNDITDGGGIGRHGEVSSLVDFTDRTKLWWTAEILLPERVQEVSFQVKYYVAQGELTLVLYDITDGAYDEQGYLSASSCHALETRTYSGGGKDVWDLTGLPRNRSYAVAPYCSADCTFDMRNRTVCRVTLWQWLYKRLITTVSWLG